MSLPNKNPILVLVEVYKYSLNPKISVSTLVKFGTEGVVAKKGELDELYG